MPLAIAMVLLAVALVGGAAVPYQIIRKQNANRSALAFLALCVGLFGSCVAFPGQWASPALFGVCVFTGGLVSYLIIRHDCSVNSNPAA